MTDKISDNCIVCAEEFDTSELHSEALSKINSTKFKVCENCLALSNPEEDYREVREIVNSYLKTSSKLLFGDAQSLINSTSKSLK